MNEAAKINKLEIYFRIKEYDTDFHKQLPIGARVWMQNLAFTFKDDLFNKSDTSIQELFTELTMAIDRVVEKYNGDRKEYNDNNS